MVLPWGTLSSPWCWDVPERLFQKNQFWECVERILLYRSKAHGINHDQKGSWATAKNIIPRDSAGSQNMFCPLSDTLLHTPPRYHPIPIHTFLAYDDTSVWESIIGIWILMNSVGKKTNDHVSKHTFEYDILKFSLSEGWLYSQNKFVHLLNVKV